MQMEGVRVLVAPSDEVSARRLLAAADDTPEKAGQPTILRRWMSRRGLTRAWTGPSIRSKPRTARYHAIAASMSSLRMPAWFTGSEEICRMHAGRV